MVDILLFYLSTMYSVLFFQSLFFVCIGSYVSMYVSYVRIRHEDMRTSRDYVERYISRFMLNLSNYLSSVTCIAYIVHYIQVTCLFVS